MFLKNSLRLKYSILMILFFYVAMFRGQSAFFEFVSISSLEVAVKRSKFPVTGCAAGSRACLPACGLSKDTNEE